MVGEIRDKETAETAIQASLTGHLVLSTIHTNDAVGAITRLVDMGIEPYLLSSTLRMVIAQRLVRKSTKNKDEYSGRTAIFEMIEIDEEIKKLINENMDENKIKEFAFSKYKTLNEDGIEKVKLGLTTEIELRRVLKESD
jgi:type II secretory ATPase GspE/PulE/Tfp pilus assembly ATPase PilB-like protein